MCWDEGRSGAGAQQPERRGRSAGQAAAATANPPPPLQCCSNNSELCTIVYDGIEDGLYVYSGETFVASTLLYQCLDALVYEARTTMLQNASDDKTNPVTFIFLGVLQQTRTKSGKRITP